MTIVTKEEFYSKLVSKPRAKLKSLGHYHIYQLVILFEPSSRNIKKNTFKLTFFLEILNSLHKSAISYKTSSGAAEKN